MGGTAQEYLFQLSVASFFEKIHSAKDKILENKKFYKIINQSKFLFTSLTKLHCLKH